MKKHYTSLLLACALKSVFILAISLSTLWSSAQTFTPITKSIDTKIGGYYEYLPVNYASNPGKKYPLIIYLHGQGEIGTGSTTDLQKLLVTDIPKRIDNGTFPATFTVGDSTFSFIIICPQINTTSRSTGMITRMIDSCYKYYRVDSSRVYITGLSMGGGTTWQFISSGYSGGTLPLAGKYITAAVPICGNYPSSIKGANYIKDAGLPVSIFHNLNDPQVSYATSKKWNDSLIAVGVNPPPVFTTYNSNVHDAWTQTYDPASKVNGLNVYEWMLQYRRVSPTQVISILTNPHAKIYGNTVINLPKDTTTLYGDSSTGTITGYQWKYVSGPTGYTTGSTTATNLNISNLSAGSYIFRLVVSGSGTLKDSIQFTFKVNAKPVVNAGSDLVTTLPADSVTLAGTATDTDGSISSYSWTKVSGPSGGTIVTPTLATTKITGLQQGTYVFRLTATDNNGSTGSDDVTVTVNPASNKVVNVNVYGGNDTYSDPAWNNWSVTAAAFTIPKTSSAFKYDDGSSSLITATLSSQSFMTNEGVLTTTYAPDSVMLHATASTAASRTLTLNGLSTSKFYDIELYAGRNFVTGAKTIFTAGTQADTVSTYHNYTHKTVFTNLTADVSGNLVITITNYVSGNYLNGFKIIEKSSSSRIAQAPVAAKASEASKEIAVKGLIISPNPVRDRTQLQLNNSSRGLLSIKVIDLSGKVQKEFRYQKDFDLFRQNIHLGNLSGGNYLIQVQVGNFNGAKMITKE